MLSSLSLYLYSVFIHALTRTFTPYHPTSDHIAVTDPEALPHLLHHTLHTSLSLPSSEPTEHPLLLTEPAWNTRQARELLAEVAFEGEGVPGVYIACSSVLSA